MRLENGYYLLESAGGEVVAVPARLVSELQLLDTRVTEEGATLGRATDLTSAAPSPERLPGAADTRPGFRGGKPQDLAGGSWNIADARRQTAVFGEPSEFSPSPIDFRFSPVHSFDRSHDVLLGSRSTWQRRVFDSVWHPEPGFDFSVDVLESSRSTWSGARRTSRSWNPTNGFSRLAADLWWGKDPLPVECAWCDEDANRPGTFTEPRAEPMTAERCARRLFASIADLDTLEWAELESEVWDDLPEGLYRAWTADGPRVLLSIAGDSCDLIAGDLRELIGIDLTETDALAYAVAEWNRQVEARPLALPATPTQQVDLAAALVGLFETTTSGRTRARAELLANRAAVERVLGQATICSRSPSFRRAQRADVDRNFEPAAAEVQTDAIHVTFWAWLSVDGEVFAYDVTLRDDSRVALSREPLAQHLGEHEDRR